MLSRETLVNLQLFMERAPCTGKESYAWVETQEAVLAEIRSIDDAVKDKGEQK